MRNLHAIIDGLLWVIMYVLMIVIGSISIENYNEVTQKINGSDNVSTMESFSGAIPVLYIITLILWLMLKTYYIIKHK